MHHGLNFDWGLSFQAVYLYPLLI